jgi:chitin disaccharide deacetylase
VEGHELAIIVNADDFGLSAAINTGIVQAFASDLISSTTLIANGPEFDDACGLALQNGFAPKVGIHINLDEGVPLTERIRECTHFCDDTGNFLPRRRWHLGARPLTITQRRALRGEVQEQISRCRQAGIGLSHADSHHHKHVEWNLIGVIINVLKSEDIPFLRLARNIGPGIAWSKDIYKRAINARIRQAGLAGVAYFGSTSDVRHALSMRPAFESTRGIEVMCHPAISGHNQVNDYTSGTELAVDVSELEAFRPWVSYSDLGRDQQRHF